MAHRRAANGAGFRIRDYIEAEADGGDYVLSHTAMLERMKADRRAKLEVYNQSALRFVNV